MPGNNNKVNRIHKNVDDDPKSVISSKNKEPYKTRWAMGKCNVIYRKRNGIKKRRKCKHKSNILLRCYISNRNIIQTLMQLTAAQHNINNHNITKTTTTKHLITATIILLFHSWMHLQISNKIIIKLLKRITLSLVSTDIDSNLNVNANVNANVNVNVNIQQNEGMSSYCIFLST